MNKKKFFKSRQFSIRRTLDSEEEKLKKRSIFLGTLTFLLAIGIVIWGIPLLAKLAAFLDKLKPSSQVQNEKKEDQIPPFPPRFSYVPEATNSAVIFLSGFSEKQSQVEIYLNEDLLAKTVANESGEFFIEKIPLVEGKNSLYAIAIDEAGNRGEPSEKEVIIYDNSPPELIIESPSNQTTVYESIIEIKGKTESEAKVTVNDHLVLTESDGSFSYKYELAAGRNEINIIAKDPAGNKKEEKLIITYRP